MITEQALNPQWDLKAWEAMERQLDQLSLEELRQLATDVGMVFLIGNDQITTKQEFIDVLDEVDRPELEKAFAAVMHGRDKARGENDGVVS